MTQEKEQKTVLVADDDPSIVDAIQLMLEMAGYQVHTTGDGHAVMQLKKFFPDLYLIDIWMSGQDGRDVCKYLKQQDSTSHIPVIMISANKDTAQIARESGADDFIAKPFEMVELLEKVEKYTSLSNSK